MRKLVTIRTIKELIPIPKKDRIEVATIDGWQVIVKKGEFTVGDSCVYFEVDSFIPLIPQLAFLGKATTFKKTTGYRIKTMRMAGVISQGLALPLSLFGITGVVGTDITQQLDVVKWESSYEQIGNNGGSSSKKSKGFPSFLPKTDQPRIQNLMTYFTTFKDDLFEETLKMDGSSITIFNTDDNRSFFKKVVGLFSNTPWDTDYFGVCSRNIELTNLPRKQTKFKGQGKDVEFDSNNFLTIANDMDLSSKIPKGYALQGELLGTKIQSNHEKVDKLTLKIFDVFDINNQVYLDANSRYLFLQSIGLSSAHVPVVSKGVKIFTECSTIDELLSRVDGESMNKGVISEGRVYKSLKDPSITFKVINNRFLLKER